MPAGDKPSLSITARRKDAPKGSKDFIKIGAGWPGKFGGYDINFRDVKEIVMNDGTVVRPSEHWFSGKKWDEPQPQRSASTPSGEPGGNGGDSGIPF